LQLRSWCERMKNKKISGFWRTYAVVTICALLLIECGLTIFYDFIAAYEKAQPNSAADAYAKSLTIAEVESWIDQAAREAEHTFDSAEVIANSCKTALNKLDGEFTCERNFAVSTINAPAYTIIRDGVKIGSIVMTEEQGGKYGFSKWTVTEKSASLSYPGESDITCTVYAPKTGTVKVNGVTLDESYLVNENTPYPYASNFEKNVNLDADVYRVTGLYSAPAVTCSLDGRECPDETNADTVLFLHPDSNFAGYTIEAPTGAVLEINGITVDSSYITASGLAYDYSVFDAGKPGLPTYDVYTVSGLIGTPEITAEYKGITATVSYNGAGAYTVSYPNELTYTVEIKAPEESEVTVGGQSLLDWKSEKELAYPELFENTTSAHYYDVYVIENLFYPIEGAGVVYKGEKIPVTVSETEREIKLTALYPATNDEMFSQLAMAFAKDYFSYVSNGYINIDDNLTKALSHVVYGSNLYDKLVSSRNGVWYVAPVTREDVKKFEVTSMNLMGDGSVVCAIEFDIDQYFYDIKREYSGKMTVLCVNTGYSWRIGSMSLENE